MRTERIDLQYNANIRRLQDIELFDENWNGYGASKFDKLLINNIANVLPNLFCQPRIFPTSRDSIQLEYETKNGGYLEFEVFSDRVEMFYEENGGQTHQTVWTSLSAETLNKEILRFT